MSGFVFLARVGDLHLIGSTGNLERRMKRLNPTEILITTKTADPKGLEARLLKRYRKDRVPETGYFKLSKEQVEDFKEQLGLKGNIPLTTKAEVNISLTACLICFSLALVSLFLIGFGLFSSLSIALIVGSSPMWILFILGNFGGYEINDLPIFSTWINRFKAFLIALGMTGASYLVFNLHKLMFNLIQSASTLK